jgi:hypothetical protein
MRSGRHHKEFGEIGRLNNREIREIGEEDFLVKETGRSGRSGRKRVSRSP